MIRHFVLLRFRDDVSDATKAGLYADLKALANHIKGIVDFHAGPNISVETPMIRGFNDAFWFDFADEAVRDAYLVDPDHQAIGGRIVAETIDGPEGVIVVDMKV